MDHRAVVDTGRARLLPAEQPADTQCRRRGSSGASRAVGGGVRLHVRGKPSEAGAHQAEVELYRWAMVTAWCVALGGSTALDTLASSLFTASKNPQDVGVLLQRCVMILTLLYIPFGVMWWFMHPVLLALGQREQLAQDVQAFLRVLSFGAPGYIYFESVKKYLQAQGIMHARFVGLDPVRGARADFRLQYSRPARRFAPQRTSQLPLRASNNPRAARCRLCNKHQLLARILPPRPSVELSESPLRYPADRTARQSMLASSTAGSAGAAGAEERSRTGASSSGSRSQASFISAPNGSPSRSSLSSQVG